MENENDIHKIRSIRMPITLWDQLDREARRMKRSINKQVEFILEEHYRLGQDGASTKEQSVQTVA